MAADTRKSLLPPPTNGNNAAATTTTTTTTTTTAASSLFSPLTDEFDETAYSIEVLQLDSGVTEDGLDERYAREAEELGISIKIPRMSADMATSTCESAVTTTTGHVRTASSTSQLSVASTGLTSPSSHEPTSSFAAPARRKTAIHRRSLSFSDYEKFLAQAHAQ